MTKQTPFGYDVNMENNEFEIVIDATPVTIEPETAAASPMEGDVAPGQNIVPHSVNDGGESFQVVPHAR